MACNCGITCDCECFPTDNEQELMEIPGRFLDLVERAAEGRDVQFELDALVMDMRIATDRGIAGPSPRLFFSPTSCDAGATDSALSAMAGER